MKNLLNLFLVVLSLSLGAEDLCFDRAELPNNFCDQDAFIAENEQEIYQYLQNFGDQGVGPKNLIISGKIRSFDLTIHSPCKIIVEDKVSFDLNRNLCLTGSEVEIQERFQFKGEDLSLYSSNGDLNIGNKSSFDGNELKLKAKGNLNFGEKGKLKFDQAVSIVSEGIGANSGIYFGEKLDVNAKNFLLTSNGVVEFSEKAKFKTAEDFLIESIVPNQTSIISFGEKIDIKARKVSVKSYAQVIVGEKSIFKADDLISLNTVEGTTNGNLILINEKGSLQAPEIRLDAKGKAELSKNVFLKADDIFRMDALTCEIDDSVNFSAQVLEGRCVGPANPNRVPVADAGSDRELELNTVIELDGSGSTDADGDRLVYQWSITNSPADSSPTLLDNFSPFPKFQTDINGTYEVSLIVSDGRSQSVADTVIISSENTRPVIANSDDKLVTVGETVFLDARSSFDLEGDSLTYEWILKEKPLNSNTSIVDSNQELAQIFIDIAGDYIIEVRAFDGILYSETETIILSTNYVSPTAKISGSPIFSKNIPKAIDGVNSIGTNLTYSWILLYKEPAANTIFTGVDTGTITFSSDISGKFVVQLIVNDGINDSKPETFTIEVRNRLPELNISEFESIVKTGEALQIDASNSTDADNDSLSFNWVITSKPDGSLLEITNNGNSSLSLTPDVSGQYEITLTLGDGEDFVSETISFVSNRVPVAQFSMPMDNIVGKSFNLDGAISSDPDGDSLTYQWEIISKPEGSTAIIPQNNLETQRILADVAGDYVVSLVVTDGFFESVPYINTIQVYKPVNNEPTFVPVGDQQIDVGRTLTLSLNAIDPEGTPIRYNLGNGQSLETGMAFDAATGIFTWTPTLEQVGTYDMNFQAYDGGNLINQSFSITVSGPLFPRKTSFSGKVLESNAMVDFGIERPIIGATVTVFDTDIVTTTNEFGDFILEDIPNLEEVVFKIDTSTATNIPEGSRWANFIEIIKPQVGVDNIVDRPFYLPLINMDSITDVTPGQETVVYNPEINIEVRIPADSAVNPDGTPYTGEFSVSLVPANLAPVSLPPGLDLSQLITVQPSGIRFTQPASITYPNLDGLAPGSIVGIIQMNDRTGQFEVVAEGQVSEDGKLIRTISGGLINTSWGGAPPSTPPMITDNENKPNRCDSCSKITGSIINRTTGEMVQDLMIDTHKSLGQQRSISLYYSSYVATGHNIEDVIEEQESISGLVSLSYRPIINGVPLNDITTYFRDTISADTTTGVYSLSYTFNTLGMKSGFYDFDLERVGRFLNSTNTRLRSLDFGVMGKVIFNPEESHVGRAWAIGDTMRVYERSNGDVALVESGFEASYYKFNEESNTYITPFGYERTLLKENGLFKIVEPNGTEVLFDELGRSVSITDRNKLQTVFGYDEQIDRLSFIQDPAGLRTTFHYKTSGLLDLIKTPSGKEFRFSHDTSGNLVEAINPDNTLKKFKYLDNGLQVQKEDESGELSIYEYGDDNEVISFSRPGEATNQLETTLSLNRDDTPRELSIPSSGDKAINLRVVRFKDVIEEQCRYYTVRYVVSSASAPLVEATGNRPIPRGSNTSARVEFREKAICWKETVNRRVNEEISPLGLTEIKAYDNNGRLAISIDPTNRAKRNFYDQKGNLVRTSDYLDLRADQTFKYDPNFSQPLEVKDYLDRITTFNLDSRGNIERVVDPLGQVTSMSYNSKGQVESIVDFLGQETRIRYDLVSGNIKEVIDPLGNITKSQYDLDGNLSQITDPKGQVTQFFYDPMNRVTKTIASDFSETNFTYDPRGNLLSVRDSRDGLTQFVYDSANRVIERIDPKGQKEEFFYSEDGELIAKTDRNGRSTFYEYDADGRLIKRIIDGGATYQYEYDLAGRVLSIDNGSNKITYSYDEVGRVKTTSFEGENTPSVTLENQYDFNGNRIGLVTPEGDFSYDYDEVNRLTKVTNPQNLVYETVYDSIGRRAKMVMPNGIETNYQYDESNRLKGLEHIKETVNLISFNYSYDRNGNITQIDNNREGFSNLNNSLSYTYDQINQLISATNPINDSSNEVFEYDDLGNRLTRDGETFQAIYDESNRLIENQSYTYTYDLEGNMTSRTEKGSGKIAQYGWDEENQLVSITERDAASLPATKTISYIYDVLGRRIEKNINDVITRYVYDNEDILFELNGDNEITKVFTHGAGIDEPYSVHDKITNTTYFYHADHLGSIIGLSDENGLIQQHYVYDSFGRARVFNNSGVEFDLANAPIQQPFGYTSRELDSESDLYYYRARYYNPHLGRFTSEDPSGFQGGESNLYLYAKNNPIANVDPSGEITVSTILIAVNAVVTASVAYNLYKIYQSAVSIAEQVKANRKKIDNLDTRLLLDDCLSDRERALIKRQINALKAFNKAALGEIKSIKRLFGGLLIKEVLTNTSPGGKKLNELESFVQNIFSKLLG